MIIMLIKKKTENIQCGIIMHGETFQNEHDDSCRRNVAIMEYRLTS